MGMIEMVYWHHSLEGADVIEQGVSGDIDYFMIDFVQHRDS